MDAVQIASLIKSTIMALQHANQTGNYSVLRDLGTPVFRERFDQAQLTAIFSNLRSRGVNFMPVLSCPKPHQTGGDDGGRQLHLVGDFPTQPLKIQYEMLFLQIDGVWRIDGMAVDAVPVQASANTTAPAAAPVPPSGVRPSGSLSQQSRRPKQNRKRSLRRHKSIARRVRRKLDPAHLIGKGLSPDHIHNFSCCRKSCALERMLEPRLYILRSATHSSRLMLAAMLHTAFMAASTAL